VTDKRPAVFLDRDGTINLDAGYIDRLERFELYPFAIDAIRLFKQAGYLVVVLTNQAGVAHGMYGEDFVATLAKYLADRAKLGGGQIDGHYYCPHSPDAAVPKYRVECECRKPKPGMARRAAEELGIMSWVLWNPGSHYDPAIFRPKHYRALAGESGHPPVDSGVGRRP